MADIDLSEFLVGYTPKAKSVPDVLRKLEAGHIICQQCNGRGKRNRIETATPALTVEEEETYERFEKTLPRQVKFEELIKCERCDGRGTHVAQHDVRAMEVVLWWTKSTCKCCGRVYDAPAHVNTITIRNDIYTPIIRDGRIWGWRYRESIYTPSAVLPVHRTLPMRIQYFEVQIEACRMCIHEQMVICLPFANKEMVA